jgi:hypothetical protein
MPKTMIKKIWKFLPLAGALSLPIASMANDASGFPTVPYVIVGSEFSLGGPDATIFLAQSSCGEGGCRVEPSGHDRPDPAPVSPVGAVPNAVGISPSATSDIVASLTAGKDFCEKLSNPAYNVDCLSYQFWLTAQSMPATGGYSDARQALLDASAKLHDLALANRDRSKPAARAKVGGKETSRLLTPVTNVAAVNAQAAVIVQNTNLVLLRSSSESNQRRLAYTQIAAVVNSTKVLLRSS